MKLICCLMIFLSPFFCRAQTIKQLNIGDAVPDITFKKVLNYPVYPTLSLSQLKNKMVIFDFMTTGCAACVRLLPHFDSLQKEFGDQIQFFLVTPESEKRVQFFLQKENIRKLNLPIIIKDTTLDKLFPHTYLSHEVVVNKGIVKAITYPEYLTSENIQSILDGKQISLLVKNDVSTFEYGKPLMVLNKSVIPDFSYPARNMYSIVTSCMNNVSRRFSTVYDSSLQQVRISMINLPILNLYEYILFGTEIRPSFIQLSVADTERYEYQKGNSFLHDWRLKNTYCYQGVFPLNFNEAEIKLKIANDLDLFLGIKGKVETKTISCWVVTNDPRVTIYNESKNSKSGSDMLPKPVSLNSIIFYLNGKFGNIPAIDETGKGDLKLDGLQKNDYTNIPVLSAKLAQYGMKITRQNRQIRILVITENNNKQIIKY